MPTLLLRISFLYNLVYTTFLYFFPNKFTSFLPSSFSSSNPHVVAQQDPISSTTTPSSSSSRSSCTSSTTSLVVPLVLVQEGEKEMEQLPMDPVELKRVFQMFDHNGDGRITKQELSDSLEKLGIHISDMELIQMIEKIDVNKDGCVDIDEFGALYQTIMDERDEEEDMKEAFNVFDQNGDGFITVEELRSVLASLGLKQGRTVEDCRKMIRKVDVDGDGMVNFKEFKQMMRGGGFAALT